MPDRAESTAAFLSASGEGDARVAPLSGDASHRRYFRVTLRSGESAVLMDAPPEKGEDVRPFIRIATVLRDAGLSAPGILAADPEAGFLLLEDLGDDLYARVLSRDPSCESRLYDHAADVVARLRDIDPSAGNGSYDRRAMTDAAMLCVDWYRDNLRAPDAGPTSDLRATMDDALARIEGPPPVLVLRDYHAENLIWLPDRQAPACVGLLDFQDAQSGHPAYDLTSLITDARRDVSPERAEAVVSRFLSLTGSDERDFRRAIATLAVQRNLRILGVFARLAIRDGKPGYLRLIPRVWGHIRTHAAHPDLTDLRTAIDAALPPPTEDVLAKLREKCTATSP